MTPLVLFIFAMEVKSLHDYATRLQMRADVCPQLRAGSCCLVFIDVINPFVSALSYRNDETDPKKYVLALKSSKLLSLVKLMTFNESLRHKKTNYKSCTYSRIKYKLFYHINLAIQQHVTRQTPLHFLAFRGICTNFISFFT